MIGTYSISITTLFLAYFAPPSQTLPIIRVKISSVSDATAHGVTYRPFDFILFARCFVLPTSAFGMIAVAQSRL
jgi:hypothetical protein